MAKYAVIGVIFLIVGAVLGVAGVCFWLAWYWWRDS
jgi:hypothetical protein